MRFPLAPYLAFAAFGVFWGTWGSVLPALRDLGGLSAAELGGALLWIGVGALPAMMFTGRAVDRFGVRITGLLLITLAAAGVLLAWQAHDLLSISVGMLLIGATSGSSDVAANALAALGEARSSRRVITLSHAVFSTFVVAGSLITGAMRTAGASVLLIFVGAALLIVFAGAWILIRGEGAQTSSHISAPRTGHGLSLLWPFVVVGLIGALGFATENAHQSWSAIFLEDELGASAWLAALAPATFAAAAAITRFAVGTTRIPDDHLLLGGAITACIGTLILASSQGIAIALIGLAIAAIGTSVLFPTLLSRSLHGVPDSYRGRATSTVGTIAYLGFVLGPVYVGILAGTFGLRGAMIGVAVLAAVFALVAHLPSRRPGWRKVAQGQETSISGQKYL